MKSSLEIALERASQLNTSTGNQDLMLKRGQQLAGALFRDGLEHFTLEWQKLSQEEQLRYLPGFAKSILANITLNNYDEQRSRISLAFSALILACPDVASLLPAIEQLLESYTTQHLEFIHNLTEQLEQHLAQKNQRYYAQTGQHHHFTRLNDPESATIYADEIKKFQLHFQEHLKQHKWRLIQALQLNPDDFMF